jgi:hypothetical protein
LEITFTRYLKKKRQSATNTHAQGTVQSQNGKKKQNRGRKHPKKGKEGKCTNDCPHSPSLTWLVKNILENPETPRKSADRILAE